MDVDASANPSDPAGVASALEGDASVRPHAGAMSATRTIERRDIGGSGTYSVGPSGGALAHRCIPLSSQGIAHGALVLPRVAR